MSVLWAIYQSDLLGIKTNLPTINVTVQVCLRNANLALKCCHQYTCGLLWCYNYGGVSPQGTKNTFLQMFVRWITHVQLGRRNEKKFCCKTHKSSRKKLWSSGQCVCLLIDDPSSNPTGVSSFFNQVLVEKKLNK